MDPIIISDDEDDANDITLVADNITVIDITDDDDEVKPLIELKRNASSVSVASTEYSDDGIVAQIMALESEPDEDEDWSGVTTNPALGAGPSRVVNPSICPAKRANSDTLSSQPAKKPRVARNDDPFVEAPPEPTPDAQTPFLISKKQRLQACFDTRKLVFGVQYEISRLLTNREITEPDVKYELLDQLRGLNNTEGAPKVVKLLKRNSRNSSQDTSLDEFSFAYAKEKDAKFPWKEQDLEDTRLPLNKDAGLGFYQDDPGWYAGKVNYRARLKALDTSTPANPQFDIILEQAELGPSNRFARQFGSKYFLRVKIPKHLWNHEEKLVAFFKRPFILNGRVYRAFYEKDKTVFLFMTNEFLQDGHISADKFHPGYSLVQFLEWHNPIDLNLKQTMTKWASRFALGLSNSAPGPVLQPERLVLIDDIVSAQDSDMTDGAGIANIATLRAIQRKFEFESLPTAVQVRINGTKGLICRASNDALENDALVQVRPSMIKIKTAPTDLAHRIIDVLRVSHARVETRLSAEVIINLAHNGVPLKALKELLQEGLDQMVAPFMQWEGPEAMFELWAMLCRHGGVLSARAARQAAGLARLKGYGEKKDEDEFEEEDEDALNGIEGSTAWWTDTVSGQPSVLEETVMGLLDAGFTPQNCSVLRDKLLKIIKAAIGNYVRQCRVLVPMSATAFIVPDEDGVLEPGEIFFKSSRRNLVGPDGLETDIITGDILLTRHPCKLPSDVRKWKAVDKACLRDRSDVIIMSVKGERRMADYLSGGDYDGDKGLLIWQPQIVQPFQNSDLSYSVPPEDIDGNFSKTNETVAQFLGRASRLEVGDATYLENVQDFLLGGLKYPSVVGAYSNMHDVSTLTLGYGHPETKRLAYMFCMVLDGAKTGLRVRPEVMKKDQKEFNSKVCKWKEKMDLPKESSYNKIYAKPRDRKNGPFIMDELQAYADARGVEKNVALEKFFSTKEKIFDAVLAAPWEDACKRAEAASRSEFGSPAMLADLDKIKEHVESAYTEHVNAKNRTPRGTKSGAGFTALSIERRQDVLRAQSRSFAAGPVLSSFCISDYELPILKASYAYIHDAKKSSDGWSRFPWDVAYRSLCDIKARAEGQSKTVLGGFYERMKVMSK